MFGYCLPTDEQLSELMRARYRSYYCGICSTLREMGGLKATLLLRYDLVFLALVLSSLCEPQEQQQTKRCPVHPVKGCETIKNEYTAYAAQIGAALGYYKLLDDWQDEKNPAKLAASALVKGVYGDAKRGICRQTAAIERELSLISSLEKEKSDDIDALCGSFGRLLGECFVYDERDVFASALRALGEALGRYIYLADACCDLLKDKKKGRFNPLLQSETKMTAAWQRDALGITLGEVAEAFEYLPLVQDSMLLKNIIYSGLYAALPENLRMPLEGLDES